MEVLVKMKKVLFVATVVKTHIMEFHIPYLKMFKDLGWETAVAARNDYENPKECIIPYCDTYYNVNFERFPLKPSNITAYRQLRKIINENEYDIVHCHTPVGGVLGRLAASQIRKKGAKVIYTAHGFHFFTGASALNWAIYYPIERIMAHYTDALITINKEDYERAKHFKAGKVYYVPGVGIDLKKFHVGHVDKNGKRKELGIAAEDFVLLSVGKLSSMKNHEVIIRSMGELKKQGKLEQIKYIVCGQGELEQYLRKLTEEMEITDSVIFLGYRNDISEICNCSDLFMFMSIQEELPIALMEAMASGLPSVCSVALGNRGLIENGVSGVMIENNIEEVSSVICKLKEDKEFRNNIAIMGKKAIQKFDLLSVENGINKIYKGEGNNYLQIQEVIEGQKLRKEFGIPLDAIVLLSVGEVNKNKNHKVVIEAINNIDNNENIYYVICGRGPLIDMYRELAKKYDIENRIILAGYRTDVVRFYKMADIFLFPSFREGLPVAVMEAMASGLPVIATKIRGSMDLIDDNNNIELLEPSDVEGISSEIKNYIEEPLLMRRGKENQLKSIGFDIETIMEAYKKIYFE